MEKLLDLLNEHFKEKYKNSKRNLIYFERYDDVNHWFNMNNEDRVYNWFVAEETIFGKRYRFIQWLVENDKLDLWSNTFTEKEEYYFWEQPDFTFQSVKYTHLLMLLSVSESPIEFLISILK